MKKLLRITTIPLSLEKLLGEQLTFMGQYFDLTAIASDPNDLDRVGKKLGVKTFPVNMTRKITPFQDLKSLWAMYRYIKKEKPDIVHTHTPKAGLIGILAARLAGVPHRLHTVAGLPLMEATGYKQKILLEVEQLIYQSATKVYPNSKGLYDYILDQNIAPSSKLKILGNGSSNGINIQHFSPEVISDEVQSNLKKDLKISNEDFIFIFVGRLVGDKGVNELVQAFSNLEKKTKNVKLLLVGPLETDLDPLLTETLSEIENNPNIISAGYQTDVRSYFAVSGALVFPSYREGFPNVVMQAGAMDLPSIVSDINGCNEIIGDYQNGLIVPVKNAEAIENAMSILLNDKQLYQQIQSLAREKITSRYEQSLVWKAILEEYQQLLAKS